MTEQTAFSFYERKGSSMLGFLAMLVLFIRPIFSTILTVFHITVASGQMGILYLIVALFAYFYIAYDIVIIKKGKLPRSMFITILVLLGILVSMWITMQRYGAISGMKAAIQSFGSATVCAALLGGLMAYDRKSLDDFCKWVPIAVLMLSVLTATTVFSGNVNAIGLITNTNGIVYQTASYYAAYALGLDLFFLLQVDTIPAFPWIHKIRWVFYILPFLQIALCFLGGGRGGFVLMTLLLVLYYFMKREKKISRKKLITNLIAAIILAAAAVIFLKQAFDTVGGQRILGFLQYRSDSGRAYLAEKALHAFRDTPILGKGINSIWYVLGIYSHNLFVDFLVETGIVGTVITCYAIIKSIVKMIRLIKVNRIYCCIFVCFIFGFMMSMFSGYYLEQPFLWFSMVYALLSKNPSPRERNHSKSSL